MCSRPRQGEVRGSPSPPLTWLGMHPVLQTWSIWNVVTECHYRNAVLSVITDSSSTDGNPFTGATDYHTAFKELEDTCRSFYHSDFFKVCVQHFSQSIHIHMLFSCENHNNCQLLSPSQVLIYSLVCMRDVVLLTLKSSYHCTAFMTQVVLFWNLKILLSIFLRRGTRELRRYTYLYGCEPIAIHTVLRLPVICVCICLCMSVLLHLPVLPVNRVISGLSRLNIYQ